MYDASKLHAELKRDEGYRDITYLDTEGIPTVGVGHNLEANPVAADIIEGWLSEDIVSAETALDNLYHPWRGLTDVRQRVLVNMAFNMGQSRLGGFRKMWAAIRAQDYEEAAVQMLDSKWAGQVGPRAPRLADMMRTG